MKKIDGYIEEARTYAHSQPKLAYENAEKALKLAITYRSKSDQAQAYFFMALACRVMSDYVNGLSSALKGLDLFELISDQLGIMKTRNIIGIIYFYYGDYASALENFTIALNLSEEVNDPNMYSSVVNNIGEVYREAKEYEKALIYYTDALEMTIKYIQDPQLELNAASIYLNIGEIYFLMKNYDRSLEHIHKSHELAIKHNNIILIGETETKLGRAMIQAEKYQLAEKHYHIAQEKYHEIDNKFFKIELLINQAELCEILGKDPFDYLQKALKDAVELQLDSKISLIYKVLSDYYEKTGDYKEALKYYKFFSMKEKEIEASNLSQKLEILSLELEHSKDRKDHRQIREVTRKLRKDVIYINKELDEIKNKNIKLMNDSMMDELTKTYNRRGIHHHYSEFLVRNDGNTSKLVAVYMIDIDYFKAYNDSLGHIQGDICLKKVAEVLKKIPCKDYFVGRFGGEEFVVIAKIKSLDNAKTLAEYMRKRVEALKLEYNFDGEKRFLTISIGAYVVDNHDSEVLQIIDQADQALYEAKKQGRNRVVFYGKEEK
jgi:diguanylate cyclase (GGDEF)-like protein